MTTLHQYDSAGFYTGHTVERDTEHYGIPFRFTAAGLPNLEEGQMARLNGDVWEAVQDPALAILAEQRQKNMDEYLATVRDMRERILNRLAGIGAAAIVSGDTNTQQAFILARQRLLDITKIPAALAAYQAADMAGLEAAVKKEYAAIVADAPPSLTKAFDEVDA